MKVIVNDESFEAGDYKCEFLGPIVFLSYIIDLANIILQSFMDIYANDTTLYK